MGSLSDNLVASGTSPPVSIGRHSGGVVDAAGKLNRLAELANEFSSERAEAEAKSLAERPLEGAFLRCMHKSFQTRKVHSA
jgi:hypothetical protein